jgi:LDH2 family malate/lactate/ureidoglycolate dehydrogenase
MKIINAQELTAIYNQIALALGARPEEAEIFAGCQVRADLRGMYTQGSAIIPYVVWLIEHGHSKFGVPLKIVREDAGFALLDGGYGVGIVLGARAMELAVKKARGAGVGCVWMQHGGDFNMAANPVLLAIEHDMVGIAMRNDLARVAPWGGRDAFFATNPIAIGVPTGQEPPIVIDMASGSFSVGQVVMAARDHRPMPTPHLVTSDGVYTDDPTKIVNDPMNRESGFTGAIVNLGYKGMAWSLIVELFAGLLSGMRTSNQLGFEPSAENPLDGGAFYMAVDIAKLRPIAEFKQAADEFARALRAVRPAEGFEKVMVPGEIEAGKERQYLRDGVPVRDDDWNGILEVAARLGVNIDNPTA